MGLVDLSANRLMLVAEAQLASPGGGGCARYLADCRAFLPPPGSLPLQRAEPGSELEGLVLDALRV